MKVTIDPRKILFKDAQDFKLNMALAIHSETFEEQLKYSIASILTIVPEFKKDEFPDYTEMVEVLANVRAIIFDKLRSYKPSDTPFNNKKYVKWIGGQRRVLTLKRALAFEGYGKLNFETAIEVAHLRHSNIEERKRISELLEKAIEKKDYPLIKKRFTQFYSNELVDALDTYALLVRPVSMLTGKVKKLPKGIELSEWLAEQRGILEKELTISDIEDVAFFLKNTTEAYKINTNTFSKVSNILAKN